MANLISPYGGELVDLVASGEQLEELRDEAASLPTVQISERAACDLELMATGGFSPLDRFMSREDYRSVVDDMRLADGTLFPIPVTLPVDVDDPKTLDGAVALRDSRNDLLAVMDVEDVYEWDRDWTARKVLGTVDVRHPLVAEMHGWGRYNLSGRLRVLALPQRHDFRELRLTPLQTREALARTGRRNVVAFQTRNPLHRIHEELTKRAAGSVDGVLLLHPAVGLTSPGDVDHYTRVRTYKALTERHYERDRVLLSLLPLAMRMAGPREAAWHAIIRRNFGANHLIVGRDHAGPGKDSQGNPFYGPYDAQELVEEHADELGVKPLTFTELAYVPSEDRYEELDRLHPEVETVSISGTQVREDYLDAGKPLPIVVHQARGGGHPRGDLSSAPPAGRLHLVHRAERFRQVDHRGRALHAADAARPADHRAGRRRGAHPPLQGPRLQQGGPRHQHTANRLRRLGDRKARRHRRLRGDKPLHRHAPVRPQHGRRRPLRRSVRRHAAGDMRAARLQGDVRQGPGRRDRRLHRHRRPLRASIQPRDYARHRSANGGVQRLEDHRTPGRLRLRPPLSAAQTALSP